MRHLIYRATLMDVPDIRGAVNPPGPLIRDRKE